MFSLPFENDRSYSKNRQTLDHVDDDFEVFGKYAHAVVTFGYLESIDREYTMTKTLVMEEFLSIDIVQKKNN